MRKNLLLIYNPSAGKNAAASSLSNMIRTFAQNGCRVVIYPILEGHGAEEIMAEERENFDYVVCCGGDGTLNHTVNALMTIPRDRRPLLGYVPTGSTNDFAVSMGIAKNVRKNCRNIVRNGPFYYDLGSFNGRYFNYVAAFGAFTEVAYSTNQDLKNLLGHSAYIMEAIRTRPFGMKYRMKARANGKTYEGDYLFCSVTDSSSVGGINIPMLGNTVRDDGLFEVTMIKSPPGLLEYQNLFQGLLIEGFKSPYLELFQTDSITFEFDSPVSWTLDGEFGGKTDKVEINVHSKAIGLVR
ncbi:MAG: YegS/Rv2252/BmrU family lipid kinase [Oscillospiraceae bacterium]|nr:YegS/Rv2252/BmrU family lipid kinase [Oscillospiraceae bacterium]